MNVMRYALCVIRICSALLRQSSDLQPLTACCQLSAARWTLLRQLCYMLSPTVGIKPLTVNLSKFTRSG